MVNRVSENDPNGIRVGIDNRCSRSCLSNLASSGNTLGRSDRRSAPKSSCYTSPSPVMSKARFIGPLSTAALFLVASTGCGRFGECSGGGNCKANTQDSSDSSDSSDGAAEDSGMDAASGDGGMDAGDEPCPTAPSGGEIRQWADVLDSPWPNNTSNVQNIQIPDPGYLAVRFQTGSVVDHGSLTDIENTTSTGVRLGTYSKCPGDFLLALPNTHPCKESWGVGGGLRWSTEVDPDADHCVLEPNTVYYFNHTYLSDPYDGNTTTCVNHNDPQIPHHCVITLNHNNF